MRQLQFNDKMAFVTFYVDVFQLLNVPEKHRVKRRVKEFLIKSIIMDMDGWELDSPDAVEELASRMDFKVKDEVYTYRGKLKSVNLLIQTKDKRLILPEGLRLRKLPKILNFHFKTILKF